MKNVIAVLVAISFIAVISCCKHTAKTATVAKTKADTTKVVVKPDTTKKK